MPSAPTSTPPLRCRCCNYDLTDLAPDSLCPECGSLIITSIGWRNRARPPAVSSCVLAVLTLLCAPCLQIWALALWGWGIVLAYAAILALTPGVRSRSTKRLAITALVLNALLFVAGLIKLILTGQL